MPLKRYAAFSGRAARQEYWMFILFQALVFLALFMLGIATASFDPGGYDAQGDAAPVGAIVIILIALFYLAMFIPTLAVQVRRFHDQDYSGWLVVIKFVPYLGWFVLLIFMCIEGTRGPNRFGADPRGGGYPAEIFS